MTHFYIIFLLLTFGLGFMLVTLSFITLKKTQQLFYKDLLLLSLVTNLFLLLEFLYIYKTGLELHFPTLYHHVYDIMWSVFWISYFRVAPRFFYRLLEIKMSYSIKLFFNGISLTAVPYAIVYLFNIPSLKSVINVAIESLLYLSALFFALLVFRHRNRTNKIEHPRYVKSLSLYFAFLLPLACLNVALNYSLPHTSFNNLQNYLIPFLVLGWYILNLLYLFRQHDAAEPLPITIPSEVQKNYSLTEREVQIIELLVQRLSYKEIAYQLFISVPTVKYHTSNIYSKLNIKNRAELLNFLKKHSYKP